LLNRGVDAIEEGHRDTRRKFLWTWLAIGILAMLCGFGVASGLTNAHNRSEDAKARAAEVKAQSDDIVRFLKGEDGLPGVPGKDGVVGAPGNPGAQGDPGPRGPAGPKGSTGAKGATGATGAVGAVGAAGAPGAQGGPG